MKKKYLLFLLFFFLSLKAYSHKLDSVIVDIHFKKDGTFKISAFIHVPHLLSLTDPFDFRTYNKKYEELIALPNDKFIKLLEDNKQKLSDLFDFNFDGKIPKKVITFHLKDRQPIELLIVGHEKSYLENEAYCQIEITGKYSKFTKILHWKNNWKNKTHFIKLIMDGNLQTATNTNKSMADNDEDTAMATTFVSQEAEKDIDLIDLPSTAWDVFSQFVNLGFIHIIQEGSDHVLFVLCLFLSFIAWPGLLKQITAFTIAHSITLGLCVYELIKLPSTIIEPLIALSIVVVAIENYIRKEVGHSRLYIVFCFGLMHGLGFAGVINEMKLPAGKRLNALFSFNVGVELGQLAVIFVAWLLIGAWFRKKEWYHGKFVKPISVFIASYATYLLIYRLTVF